MNFALNSKKKIIMFVPQITYVNNVACVPILVDHKFLVNQNLTIIVPHDFGTIVMAIALRHVLEFLPVKRWKSI